MKLYHFSSIGNLKKIDVQYFGKNSFTKNDANISTVKRAFYYAEPKPLEYLLESSTYRYTVKIDAEKIYDLTKDNKGYTVKFNNIDAILRELQKNFDAVTYDCGFQCYNVFKPLTVKEIKKL